MSAIEYNNLLFKTSQRLNELNLFVELEQKKFLGPDKLNILELQN